MVAVTNEDLQTASKQILLRLEETNSIFLELKKDMISLKEEISLIKESTNTDKSYTDLLNENEKSNISTRQEKKKRFL